MFEPDTQPVGPFLTAQWAIFVTNDLFSETVQWFTQHRGKYDVLIHPNSGCEIEDHSWWTIWAGNPWEINLDAMGHDQPFPWPGDSYFNSNTSPTIEEIKNNKGQTFLSG
jgi:aromatic ring-cleaving dioxygenase